ncbi:formyltransferase family protein [Balneolales bacterium ANBcel1]|nr:formyltransferase family protein [Balneolales bacterium ANBcel1]
MKAIILCSTNGSVLSKTLEQSLYLRKKISAIVTDRPCGAEDIARFYGIDLVPLYSKTGEAFSDAICKAFSLTREDLIISFYTRLLKGRLLQQMKGRILNFHPSILPAFPGLGGFEDTLKSGARFMGATVHLVDEGMDTGLPVIQSARPIDPNLPVSVNRHKIFLDQCRMLLQVVRWFDAGRVRCQEDGVYIDGATFECGTYSPSIDDVEAQRMTIPHPVSPGTSKNEISGEKYNEVTSHY